MNELYYCRLEPGNRSQSHYVDEKFPTKSFFCVPVFLNPTISYFLSFEKRTKSQVRSTTKSQCNIARICKKRGKKNIQFSHPFVYPHFTRLVMHASLLGLFLFCCRIKRLFLLFLSKERWYFRFLSFWYWIFQTWTAWHLQVLDVRTYCWSPAGHSLRAVYLQGWTAFGFPVFLINHSKHKFSDFHTYPIILLSEYSFLLFTSGAAMLKKLLEKVWLSTGTCRGEILVIRIPQEAKCLQQWECF